MVINTSIISPDRDHIALAEQGNFRYTPTIGAIANFVLPMSFQSVSIPVTCESMEVSVSRIFLICSLSGEFTLLTETAVDL